MRLRHLYFVIGHVALLLPEAIVFAATTGNAILGIVVTNLFLAALLYTVAFIRRTEQGISAGRLVLRGGLTTLACLPIWFLAFLVLSWVTADSILVFGLVFFVPLSAVSSGLAAVLGLGFRRETTD